MISFKAARIGTLIFLIVGFVFTMTSAFAFWREVTVTTEVEITTIGSPIEILVTDLSVSNDGLRLVPKGYAIAVGDVERIEFYYNIGVSRELLNEVTLQVSINDILINNDDTYSQLVSIEVMGEANGADLDLFNDIIMITIVVELLEPIDLEEATAEGLDLNLVNVDNAIEAFEAIKGQDITFAIRLELIQKAVTE
ncbi:MAG: hypothetical protein KQ78_00648 [Candidatus Izimaplasma bacterium HR2]|nr:MAG: hypothetical protein KQ78_00648 [Candidatus Izimaplasma bacterium HR2]